MLVERKKTNPKVWQDIVPARPTMAPKKKQPLVRLWVRLTAYTKRSANNIRRLTWPRSKKRRLIVISLLIVITVGIVAYMLLRQPKASSPIIEVGDGYSVQQLSKGTPEYATVLPSGKTIEDFGGWTRVSPSDRAPAFAYTDSLGGSPINVSQQKLPDSFKPDTADQVRVLAEDFNANQILNVGDIVVYIGRSAKGPQSVIFTKNDLLIFIRSSVTIENSLWASYISSLR